MITLTKEAIHELRNLLEKKFAAPDEGLRLSVNKGGCAGLQYEMDIAAADKTDETLKIEDVLVHVSQEAIPYIKGSVVEYNFSLSDAGFKIKNPNASRSCGCGTSFEAVGEEGTYDPEEDCTTK